MIRLQTHWVCRTCRKEWLPAGPWSPVNVFNPQTRQFESWDGVHCVNPECWSEAIEPRVYMGDVGSDVPRLLDGSFGGVVGTYTDLMGFSDVLGAAAARLTGDPPPLTNPTMRLAEAAATTPPPYAFPDWVPE